MTDLKARNHNKKETIRYDQDSILKPPLDRQHLTAVIRGINQNRDKARMGLREAKLSLRRLLREPDREPEDGEQDSGTDGEVSRDQ